MYDRLLYWRLNLAKSGQSWDYENTGLGDNGSNCLPVTRKYCCIAELRSVNLFSALRCFIISLLM